MHFENIGTTTDPPTRIDYRGKRVPITCCHHLRQIYRARAGLPPCPSGLSGNSFGGFDGLTWKGYLYYAAIGGLVTSGAMVGMQYMQQQKARIEAKEKKEKPPEGEGLGGPATAGFIMGAIIYPGWKFIVN